MVFTVQTRYYLTATSPHDPALHIAGRPVVQVKQGASMLYSHFFIPTAREAPKDAVVQSHILMIRAGIVARLSSGLYGFLPLGNRVLKKVEKIIREEMERIEANEFFLPVLIPGELWKESNRWYSMGAELFRLKDRNSQDFVLAPTHEEVFTYLLKDHVKSYRDLPFTVYHIGLKFRDEIRPRFGVMRGKSFIMKDAYSFHPAGDELSLDKTYRDMSCAYRNIFKRCGLDTIPVAADSGTMGGSASEEFMVPSHVGEEEIAQCRACGYVANREKASTPGDGLAYNDTGEISLVHTPDVKTIAALEAFLKMKPDRFIKTLIYRYRPSRKTEASNEASEDRNSRSFVLALIRGDLEINETKLKNVLDAVDLEIAEIDEAKTSLGIPIGFAGPIGAGDVTTIADHSVRAIKGGVTGANREDYHYLNVNAERDFEPDTYADLRLVREGDRCPNCGKALSIFRGIELGHIFKLGDKYTRAFTMTYLDRDGSMQVPIMGCYGIGVERTVAAVIEQNHDEDGIVWPLSVAPFHVYLLPVKYDGETKTVCDRIYRELGEKGVEVLLDDRELRPGVKFKDADLIGIPFRITVGDRGLEGGTVELVHRGAGKRESIKVQAIVEHLGDMVQQLLKSFS
jgi:prolyl-tRNA synthetase